MKAKTSWRRMMTFAPMARNYLEKEEKDTKLKWAISRVLSQLDALQAKINLELSDIAIDKAMEYPDGEKKGALMKHPDGSYVYSKAGTQARDHAQNAMLDRDEVEFDAFYATKIPEGIDLTVVEAFRGIVISNEDADRILGDYESKADAAPQTETKPNGAENPLGSLEQRFQDAGV